MAVYCKGPLGKIAPHEDAEWATMQALIADVDLDATARQSKALLRRRGVADAASLLRLALAYSVSNLSLRSTAAWSTMAGVADLGDVALLKRFRNAGQWLASLWQTLLSQETKALPMPGLNQCGNLVAMGHGNFNGSFGG